MSAPAFELRPAREAHEPPEARGLARDAVRLMVATRADGAITHARFHDLPDLLAPGDLLVVNTSSTIPAAILATREDGATVELHFATRAPDPPGPAWWVVELRSADGATPFAGTRAGERLALAGGAHVEVVARYAGSARLWLARLEDDLALLEHLARHGHPIRYRHVHGQWPLTAYQTAYARRPGSAEMPSAGRPFTPRLLTRLLAGEVLVAPLVLHTGVSSLERHEAPYPERYEVPATTAALVGAVHGWGGRVIAVGTTVVRALETAVGADGRVRPAAGWTDLVVSPERGLRAVDGLIIGWHEPQASHLRLLEAAAGPELLARCYAEALEHGYLWHEFGDSHLILP